MKTQSRKISESYFRLIIVVVFSLCCQNILSTDKQPGNGTLNDGNIHYVGRWDKSDTQIFRSYWTGAYLRVEFTGKSIGLKLASSTNLVVIIDGEPPRSVIAIQGVTQLNVSPLSAGTHTLLVGSSGQNYELSFQGLVLEAGAVTYSPSPKRLIEYIGDSITAGTGPEDITAVNYAWNTAEALNCDHTQIAFSGLSLTTNYGCLENKVGLDSLYFNFKNYNHLNERPVMTWDFSYTPDMVVVALGTNDKCGNATDAVVMKSSSIFIQRLRVKYPFAKIVVMRPFNGSYEGPLSAAVRKMNKAGDIEVYYINTYNWLTADDYSDGTHPNAVGGKKIVDALVPILSQILQTLSDIPTILSDKVITLSPNPCKQYLQIKSMGEEKIQKVTVRTLLGNTKQIFHINNVSTSLDLSQLIDGYYLLTTTMCSGKELSHKIFKN